MGRKAKHDKQDWIMAAFKALETGGIDAVRVERLAKSLGATKGSFYWHFTDRPALLTAVVDFWEAEGTKGIIEHLGGSKQSPADQLRELAIIASEKERFELDAIKVEGALRAWAAQEEWVAQRIAKIEASRIAFLDETLTSIGHEQKQAKQIAQQLYLMLLGLYSIERHNPSDAHRTAFIEFAEQACTVSSN